MNAVDGDAEFPCGQHEVEAVVDEEGDAIRETKLRAYVGAGTHEREHLACCRGLRAYLQTGEARHQRRADDVGNGAIFCIFRAKDEIGRNIKQTSFIHAKLP